MNKFLLEAESYLGAGLLNLLSWTVKIKRNRPFVNYPAIYMIWHRDQIPLTLAHKYNNIGAMISNSKDGQLIAGPVSKLGFEPIRGSSSRGGTTALRNIIKHLKHYPITITPDGPRGPIYSIKDGILTTAYLTKKPIIPIAVDINKEWVFNSWDKFRFPKPFSTIHIAYGDEHFVESKEDFEKVKLDLKNEMDYLKGSLTSSNIK